MILLYIHGIKPVLHSRKKACSMLLQNNHVFARPKLFCITVSLSLEICMCIQHIFLIQFIYRTVNTDIKREEKNPQNHKRNLYLVTH